MYYPYFLYSANIDHFPLFAKLKGDPYILDLSNKSKLLKEIDARDQRSFQQILEKAMGKSYGWGLSSYLERREILLADCPQMVAEKRFVHLGLDVIVPLGKTLYAPLGATVSKSGYESGEGNYGGFVLLKHESPQFETFYSFYGHLCKNYLPQKGTVFKAGSPFAQIGDFHENGNWFYHTHVQILTQQGLDEGYLTKGYCREADLAKINDLCPTPIPLFKAFA